MFTWICPKCGKEVPPAYSECPNCSGKPDESEPGKPAAAAPVTPAAAPVMRAAPAGPARTGMPAWLASVLFAIGFAALLGGGYWAYDSLSHRQPRPAQTAAAAPVEAPAMASPAVQANPILRNLEITGLRLVEDAKQKTSLQFVVVNHSAADLGEVSAKANLRAATSKPEQPPITTFAFRTSLGPYEAKDLKLPVETKLRVYELPDWQFLRAELIP